MSDELRIEVPPALVEEIASRAAEIVLQRLVAEHAPSEQPPYLTVKRVREAHRSTPAAVRARIRRGKLDAKVPPGGREYLLPNPDATEQAGGHGATLFGSPNKVPPARLQPPRGVTPRGKS